VLSRSSILERMKVNSFRFSRYFLREPTRILSCDEALGRLDAREFPVEQYRGRSNIRKKRTLFHDHLRPGLVAELNGQEDGSRA
jgi:hypothetical protein